VYGVLLFQADDGAHGVELWRSDWTEKGTVLVQDIAPGPRSSSPSGFIAFGNRIIFTADDRINGREPWIGRGAILTNQPERAIRDLRDEVKALGLTKGIERSLTAKLDVATEALTRQDGDSAAIVALEDFMKEVNAQSPKRI